MPIFQNTSFAAFLFDMDGTLVDSTPVVERIWRQWAARHNIDAEALLATVHGVRSEDTVRKFAPEGVDQAAEVHWLLEQELNDVDGVIEIPGAVAFIKSLAPDQWAVVTSADRELAAKRLTHVGIPLPKVFISAKDVTRGKPDPEGFCKAAELLGVDIKQCLAFEDAPAGVAAIRAAGATTVIVGGHVQALPGEYEITAYPCV